MEKSLKATLTLTFWTSPELLSFISVCFLIAEAVSQGGSQVCASPTWTLFYCKRLSYNNGDELGRTAAIPLKSSEFTWLVC